jgi:hypothetical protein
MIIGTTNLVVNEIGAVFNVRIEGDTDANLLYTDATNDRIGVGTISPSVKFEVNGAAKASSLSLTTALPVASGGTNATTASITSFNNITGYSASGASGTTTTNLVFSTSPSITTPTLVGDVPLSTGNIVFSTADKGLADSTSAQQVFVSTNGTGFGAGTPAGYKISTQVSTSDAALSRHYRLKSGGGTAIASMCTETATGITTAKRIAGLESASFIIVTGNDGSSNEFMDLLVSNNSGTPTVITSKTTSGSPAARTYTLSSFNLNLAMASGTYATNTMWFQLSNR